MVRIRVRQIESSGSYRVNKIAWSKKVYRVAPSRAGRWGEGLEGVVGKVAAQGSPENAPVPPTEAAESRQTALLILCSMGVNVGLPLLEELLQIGSGRGARRAAPCSRALQVAPRGVRRPPPCLQPLLEELDLLLPTALVRALDFEQSILATACLRGRCAIRADARSGASTHGGLLLTHRKAFEESLLDLLWLRVTDSNKKAPIASAWADFEADILARCRSSSSGPPREIALSIFKVAQGQLGPPLALTEASLTPRLASRRSSFWRILIRHHRC